MPLLALPPPSGRFLSFPEREELAVLRAQRLDVRRVPLSRDVLDVLEEHKSQ